MRKYLLLLAAAAMVAAAAPARAGYVANFGPTTINTPDTNGNLKADVGETFATVDVGAPRLTTSGVFTGFANTGQPGDPELNNADLPLYGFELLGSVTAAGATSATYGGTYAIRYFDPSATIYTVSQGTFAIDANFDQNGVASLMGTLTEDPAFVTPAPWADFGQFGPATIGGTYVPTVPGQQGVINGYIAAGTVIPEPGSMALLAMGALPLLGLRRRK